MCCCSFAQSCLTICEHIRLPCPSPSPITCWNSCPLSLWCHSTILCCPLLFLPSIFPSVRFFFFFFNVLALHIRYQSSGASASASVYLMNIQDWFPLGLTGLISLQSKGFSRVFSNTTVQSIKSSAFSLLYGSTLTSIHDYWKKHSFVYTDLCQQKLCLSVFNILSRFRIGFLLLGMCLRVGSLGSHHLQWFWSPRKSSLSLFPLFPHLFAMKWWG